MLVRICGLVLGYPESFGKRAGKLEVGVGSPTFLLGRGACGPHSCRSGWRHIEATD